MKAPTFRFYKHPLAEKETYVSLAPPYHPSFLNKKSFSNKFAYSDLACLPFLLCCSDLTISDLLSCSATNSVLLPLICCSASLSSEAHSQLHLLSRRFSSFFSHIQSAFSFSLQQQLFISVPAHYIDSPHAEVFHAFLHSNSSFPFFHSFFCFCMLSFSLIF
jgi:hypothetical protein